MLQNFFSTGPSLKFFDPLRLMAAAMLMLVGVNLAGCGGPGWSGEQAELPVGLTETVEYTLGPGDRLRVIVFKEPELSGEFEISGTGVLSLPLIGQVEAEGLTVSGLEDALEAEYADGYLVDPRVNVEVLNYRPFFIIGEVQGPGSYPYSAGMTALNAVAQAGGFTYRADQSRIFLTRGDGAEFSVPFSQRVVILPGDIIRVPERFF